MWEAASYKGILLPFPRVNSCPQVTLCLLNCLEGNRLATDALLCQTGRSATRRRWPHWLMKWQLVGRAEAQSEHQPDSVYTSQTGCDLYPGKTVVRLASNITKVPLNRTRTATEEPSARVKPLKGQFLAHPTSKLHQDAVPNLQQVSCSLEEWPFCCCKNPS